MELRDTPGNYRAVSLTSRVGKVLKTAARGGVEGCRGRHGSIMELLARLFLQKGRSCPRNLLKCFEAIMASTAFKRYSGAQNLHIFSVPHQPPKDT